MVGFKGDGPALVRAALWWSARWALLAGLALAAALFAATRASGAPPEQGAPAATVRMTAEMRFEPAQVRVRAGEAVLWRNASSLTHTATADPSRAKDRRDVALPEGAPAFHSGDVAPGGSWRQVFTVPGTYRYFCVPHETKGMVATVEVLPAR
jgi:plastocyanin